MKGCTYEVVRDVPGKPAILKLLGMPGRTATVLLPQQLRRFAHATLDGRSVSDLLKGRDMEVAFPGKTLTRPWHRRLAGLAPVAADGDAEAL